MILINREGKKLPLSSELHYTMEAEAAGETVIRIQLTGRGMAYVAENLSYGANKPQLQIRFSVCVLSGVPDGKELSGVAEIIRKNKPEGSGAVSEKASVYSGGIRIQKVNERGEGLAGAVFQLAREASPSELQDPDIRTKPLQIGEKAIQAVAVPFYTGESDAPAYQVVTDASGGAVMHGLAAGNYYLVETHAPEGYNILNAPVWIRVTKYSHLSEADQIRDDAGRVIDSTVRIVATQYVLPQTGGAGILCLIFSGGSLVLCAMVLCILRQKKLLWRW